MTNQPLDVLIVESHPGLASGPAADLTEAGHRVHYCHDGFDHGVRCRGLQSPSTCPIEDHVDVAFLAREGMNPRPSSLEEGVRCAIRAHIPLVEQGQEMLDPFAPWVAERVEPGSDIDAACRRVSGATTAELENEIRRRVRPLLATTKIRPNDLHLGYEPSGTGLVITLVLPVEVELRLRQALAVRVLDALRSAGRTFGRVDVNVTAAPTS